MNKPINKLEPANDKSDAVSGEQVEKIRDILFGGQMAEYERRFNDLEARARSDLKQLQQDIAKRFESTEGFLKQEIEQLQNSQQQERKDRLDALQGVDKSIAEVGKQLELNYADIDDRLSQDGGAIRKQIHNQQAELEQSISRLRSELVERQDTQQSSLEQAKLSREVLAGMFDELALRLRGEFELPED